MFNLFNIGDKVKMKNVDWFKKNCTGKIDTNQHMIEYEGKLIDVNCLRHCGEEVTVLFSHTSDIPKFHQTMTVILIEEDEGNKFFQDWCFE
jgi:hypothetical protein